jgi:hypothetical protein
MPNKFWKRPAIPEQPLNFRTGEEFRKIIELFGRSSEFESSA